MAKLPGAIQGARVVGERFIHSQRQQNPEGRMPLMDHLRELRNRVVKIVLALVAGMIIGLVFFDPIWKFIERPYCRAVVCKTNVIGHTLMVTGPLDGFYLHIKVGYRRRDHRHLPGVAVPDLGVRRPRAVRPGEALDVHLPRHPGSAVLPGRDLPCW